MNNDIDLQRINDITNKTIDKKRKLAVKQFKKVSKKFHKQCVKGVKKSAKKGNCDVCKNVLEITSSLLSYDEKKAIVTNEIQYWENKGFKADTLSRYEILINWNNEEE